MFFIAGSQLGFSCMLMVFDHQWISLACGKFGDPNDDARPHTNMFLVSCITIGYLCMIAGVLAGVVVCWGCIMKVCCNATIPNPIVL